MKIRKNKYTELAWAAGFYDGEGSSKKIYSFYKNKDGSKRQRPNSYISMSISQAELGPLKRFQKAIGKIGHINGPYQYKPNKRPYWVWSASCQQALDAFKLLKPYLSTVKKKQFQMVLKETQNNPNRKKGWIHDEVKSAS